MCCAQTAAPDGEKMMVGESMHGFSASINALCRSNNRAQKSWHNLLLRLPKIQPGQFQNLSKSSLEASWRAKMHPRGTQDQSEGAQEGPRGGQEAPKKRPRASKTRPRASKTRPKRSPGTRPSANLKSLLQLSAQRQETKST